VFVVLSQLGVVEVSAIRHHRTVLAGWPT
jgi:hypothetical protein